MLAVLTVYTGLLACVAGGVWMLRAGRRRRGLLVLAAGTLTVGLGATLPAPELRLANPTTLLDQFAPVCQFHEVHTTRVAASREQVYQAIQEVTAGEILFFRTLTWLRRFGRPGPESILNAPERLPLLEVATRTSFLRLGETPGREIVVGTIVLAPPGWRLGSRPSPDDFRTLNAPGFAKASMNFLVEESGTNASIVTTETRVYATDPGSRRCFAAYWRIIYPGSAWIRRVWLRAIRVRAEGG